MEIFLYLNHREIVAEVAEQHGIILSIASSRSDREELSNWLREHIAIIGRD